MKEKNKNLKFSNDDEIDFIGLLKTIKRQKKLIFSITSSFTLISIIYSILAKPIYRGSLDIVVNQSQENNFKNKKGQSFNTSSIFQNSIYEQKTQEYILKSPSVLMPIFNYVKEYSNKKGINNEYMNYKEWLRKSLDIKFTRNTNVLTVGFISDNKKFIIDVLNKISEKYRDYSKL